MTTHYATPDVESTSLDEDQDAELDALLSVFFEPPAAKLKTVTKVAPPSPSSRLSHATVEATTVMAVASGSSGYDKFPITDLKEVEAIDNPVA